MKYQFETVDLGFRETIQLNATDKPLVFTRNIKGDSSRIQLNKSAKFSSMMIKEGVAQEIVEIVADRFDDSLAFQCDLLEISEIETPCEISSVTSWIHTSDKMPPEHDSIFAKHKGTDKWTCGMFERCSDNVQITVENKDGCRFTTTGHTVDGVWKSDILDAVKEAKVVAWTPLMKPCED